MIDHPHRAFAMRLALCLGRTLGELGRSMTSTEFAAWVAYDRVEGLPWPWLQSGLNTSTLVNAWRGKNTRPRKPSDFMPIRKRPARQTPQQMLAIFRAFAARRSPGTDK